MKSHFNSIFFLLKTIFQFTLMLFISQGCQFSDSSTEGGETTSDGLTTSLHQPGEDLLFV